MSIQRILIITYSFAPMPSPRAARWSALARHWGSQGITVDVVCAGGSESRNMPGVNVFGTGQDMIAQMKKKLTVRNRAFSVLKSVYDLTWKKIYWPDFACTWFFKATPIVKKLLKKNKYDVCFSVSMPFTSHLVGLKMRRSDLPWITDFGDPFTLMDQTPPNNFKVYGPLNYFVENKVLKKCDMVSVTTRETKELYESNFVSVKNKIRVIPPLVSLDQSSPGKFFTGSDKAIRLVFTGNLYKSLRRPDHLLQLLSGLLETELGNNIELHFIGGLEYCKSSFEPYNGILGKHLFLHGQIPKSQADQALKEAHILINIGNATSFQLPSKVIQYAATGLPIINIHSCVEDSSKNVLKEYPSALNLFIEGSLQNIPRSAIQSSFEFIKKQQGRGFEKQVPAWINRYGIDSISLAYLALIDEAKKQ